MIPSLSDFVATPAKGKSDIAPNILVGEIDFSGLLGEIEGKVPGLNSGLVTAEGQKEHPAQAAIPAKTIEPGLLSNVPLVPEPGKSRPVGGRDLPFAPVVSVVPVESPGLTEPVAINAAQSPAKASLATETPRPPAPDEEPEVRSISPASAQSAQGAIEYPELSEMPNFRHAVANVDAKQLELTLSRPIASPPVALDRVRTADFSEDASASPEIQKPESEAAPVHFSEDTQEPATNGDFTNAAPIPQSAPSPVSAPFTEPATIAVPAAEPPSIVVATRIAQPKEARPGSLFAPSGAAADAIEPLATKPVLMPEMPAACPATAASPVAVPQRAIGDTAIGQAVPDAAMPTSTSGNPGPVPTPSEGLASLSSASHNSAPAASPHAPTAPVIPQSIALTPAPEVRAEARLAPQLESTIEQLSETRQSALSSRPELTVRHQDFGAITMRVEALGNDLRATLSARDPGFVPAIQAALAERAIVPAAETSTGQSHNPQRGQEQTSQALASSPGSQGQGWNSEGRYGSSTGSGQGTSQPYRGQSDGRDDDTIAQPRSAFSGQAAGTEGATDLFA